MFVLTAALAISGCSGGEKAPVVDNAEGVILLDGEPLKRVEVSFILESEIRCVARGVSDDNGHFTLKIKDRPGAYAGENMVVIRETAVPDNVKKDPERGKVARYYESLGGRPLPEQYTSLVDNPLKVTVKAGQQIYNVVLTR
jgi:hypothetical protein